MRENRLAGGGRARNRIAHDGPVVHPADWLEMNDAAVRAGAVEVQEPSLALRRFDIPALVWRLNLRTPLREYGTELVRPVDVLRTQHRLRPLLHAAIRREDVVPAVALE